MRPLPKKEIVLPGVFNRFEYILIKLIGLVGHTDYVYDAYTERAILLISIFIEMAMMMTTQMHGVRMILTGPGLCLALLVLLTSKSEK